MSKTALNQYLFLLSVPRRFPCCSSSLFMRRGLHIRCVYILLFCCCCFVFVFVNDCFLFVCFVVVFFFHLGEVVHRDFGIS